MRRGSIGESIPYLPPIPASIIPDCTFHCVTYFPAHRQSETDRHVVDWLAHRPWRTPSAPPPCLALAGCWVDPVVGSWNFETKISRRRRIGLNVQCTNILYFRVPFLLRIRDGSISAFCKIDTISKKINLVSVYS